MNISNLISGSSAFFKPSLYIWKFSVCILLKPSFEDFEHKYHILSELFMMSQPSWVTLHNMADSFIDLHKPLNLNKSVILEVRGGHYFVDFKNCFSLDNLNDLSELA